MVFKLISGDINYQPVNDKPSMRTYIVPTTVECSVYIRNRGDFVIDY